MILVAADGSEAAQAATRVALELASATGDTLLFVTAWHELHTDLGIPLSVVVHDFVEAERDWANEIAAAAVALAGDAGVEAETLIRHGDPGREICAVARERRARMIVIGSRGLGRVSGALLGSVSGYVLRKAPCPVVVASPTAHRGDDGDHADTPGLAAQR